MNPKRDNEINPCDIKIDKDGVWYYRGAEMFRREIVNLFYQHLKQDQSGRYIIELENDKCYLEVEDAPFVINAVNKQEGANIIYVTLSDETSETLDLSTLWVGKDNVIYCRVKDQLFDARFTRKSYYQLAAYIEHDEINDDYFILLNAQKHYLKKNK